MLSYLALWCSCVNAWHPDIICWMFSTAELYNNNNNKYKYMDGLKLLGRNENDLKNEMKIVQTISKDINMNFGLEKCARICLKRGSVQSIMHVASTFENDIKSI